MSRRIRLGVFAPKEAQHFEVGDYAAGSFRECKRLRFASLLEILTICECDALRSWVEGAGGRRIRKDEAQRAKTCAHKRFEHRQPLARGFRIERDLARGITPSANLLCRP